jgi:hypothetical protein
VQWCERGGAESGYASRVGWNLRFEQDDMHAYVSKTKVTGPSLTRETSMWA